MTSITDIPYEDIKVFLTKNNIRLSLNESNNYNTAFKMIKQDKNYIYPDSVYDWIIAYNFRDKIDVYTKGMINSLSEEELNNLAKQLGIFDSNDLKYSVINVLGYLHKYDKSFVHSDLDQNIFQMVDEQRILSSDYKEIIKNFKRNKTLRLFLLNNMRKIIIERYKDVDGLLLFIVDLLGLEEIILAEEALKISNNLITDQEERNNIMSFLYYRVIESKNVMVIENYFKLLQYIRQLYGRAVFGNFQILQLLDIYLTRLPLKEYRKVLISFLVAAIEARNKIFANGAINIWYNTRDVRNSCDEWFTKFKREMDNIIKVVDSI